MMRKLVKSRVLLASGLLGVCFASGVWAADVAKLVGDCANCHGKDGASTDKNVPIIGGDSANYITDTFAKYKNKERPCPEVKYLDGPHKGGPMDMCKVANEMSDDDVKAIAEHFAAKPFVRAKQTVDPALAAKGKAVHEQYCGKCHSDGGSVASDDAGILAGQWMPVIAQQLKEFGAGERPMVKKMKAKFDKLGPADLEALPHYYGSFK
jgi:cytochrome subunit of sulfide dehydrogenase